MALLFVFLILGYLSSLGIAVSSAFARRISVTLALVSPAIGMGIVIPLTLTFNRAGMPISDFGLALIAILGVAAVAVIAWRRPIVPWRELLPFTPAIIGAVLFAGAPMLRYGLDWIGNSNDDMLVYVLSAAGLMHDGFFHVPPVDQIVAGSNISQNTWFWELLPPNRYGTDVFLGVAAAALRVDPIYVYMATSVAGFTALVAATGALCTHPRLPKVTAPIAAAVLAIGSPMTVFSVYQQILPQILGLVAMVGFTALVQIPDATRREMFQRAASLGCIATMLSYVYPEISPILGLGAFLYAPFALWHSRHSLFPYVKHVLSVAAIAVAVILVLQNIQIFTFSATMSFLFGVGARVAQHGGVTSIFYFLVPSGFANLWGFVPMGFYPKEPWLSIAIVAGALALAATAVGAVRSLLRGSFSGAMMCAFLLFFVQLFAFRSSYALFKMTFLAQPFMAPFVALGIVRASTWLKERFNVRLRYAVSAALVLLVASQSYGMYIYLGTTSDLLSKKTPAFTELLAASRHDVYGQVRQIAAQNSDPSASFLSDAILSQLTLIEGNALRGHSLEFSALDPFKGLYGFASDGEIKIRQIVGWPAGVRLKARSNALLRKQILTEHRIPVGNELILAHEEPYTEHAFVPASNNAPSTGVLLETGNNLSILNASDTAPGDAFDVRAVPWRQVHDRLSIVDSELGHPPDYPSKLGDVAFGPVEPDPIDPNRVITTVGRSMLLEVFNPSAESVRLRMAVTASLNPAGNQTLQPISVIGTRSFVFPSLGEGSTRLLTPPVRPFEINGHHYIALTFGQRLMRFKVERTGLMRLFGNDIQLDERRFILFGRDISVEKGHLDAPSALSTIPGDLYNPALLYSGLYEDGWMARKFSVTLRSSPRLNSLRIRALVLRSALARDLTVTIDGRSSKRFVLAAGPERFVDLWMASPSVSEHQIRIDVPRAGIISPADHRRAWGRVSSIAFEGDVFGAGVALVQDAHWNAPESDSNGTSRWITSGARFTVAAASNARDLRIALAPGPSAAGPVDLELIGKGQTMHYRITSARDILIKIPKSSATAVYTIALRYKRQEVPGDKRELPIRIFSMSLADSGG